MSPARSSLVGAAWAVAAALSYGATNISIKLSGPHLTVWQTAMGRFVLGAVLVPFLASRLGLDLWGRSRGLLVVHGLTLTGAFLLIIQSLRLIPLSEAMILLSVWPVFASLLSPWLAKEPTTRREWPLVAGAVAGTALILWPDRLGPGLNLGHFLALGTGFLAGLSIVLIRLLGRTNNALSIYFYFCLSGGLVCLGPLLAQAGPLQPATGAGWLGLIAVAVLAMGGQVLTNQGLKYLKPSQSSGLLMIEILSAAAFGTLVLGEPLSWRLTLGAVLILGCGLALIVLPGGPLKKANQQGWGRSRRLA